MVAAQQQQMQLGFDDFAFFVAAISGNHHRFDHALQGNAQKLSHIRTSGFAWCGHFLHGLRRRWAAVRGCQRFRFFDIGGVITLRAIDDGIFTRSGDDLEFFAQIATYGAAIGSNGAVAQAKTIKDFAVSRRHILITGFGAGCVFIKTVSVFHDEFAPAHQAKTRAAFVTKFGLDLIQIFRQLFIAFELLPRDVSDHFFTGGLDDEVAPMPVLYAQQLRPHFFKASRLLPQLGRLHHGHGQLYRAGLVHFFADDGFDLANHAQPQRHVVVDASA